MTLAPEQASLAARRPPKAPFQRAGFHLSAILDAWVAFFASGDSRSIHMRKLILVALLAAAPLLGSTPAAAFGCGWFGYGYSSAASAPRAYSYAPPRRYYRPRVAGAYYGRTFYRPRVAGAYYSRTFYRPRVAGRAYYGRTIYRPGARVVARRAAWGGARRWR